MIGMTPACLDCRHFHKTGEIGLTCDAFPGGIPEDIILASNDHSNPYPGDHGIQFEPRETPRDEE